MERRMQELLSSLGIGLNDEVRMIGIKGMGGIGKTTLARAIFDKFSSHFEGSAFVEDVREVSKKKGLRKLQKRVLSGVLNDKHIRVESVYDGKRIMRMRLPYKKVLLVLDDVDDVEQLRAVAGDWFNGGSRIIITTRDEKVLRAHGVNVKWIHDVSLLSDEEAMSLFSWYAFERYIPDEGFEKLSSAVVCYAAGLPLTIKVLGSHLRGENKLVWEDALKRLRAIPSRETLQLLEISYNSLEDDLQEMFLDVACFLKGMDQHSAIIMLDSCGYHATYGLRILQEKSLLTISNYRLAMHDRLEELGRYIVRRSHPHEPNKHSRLWIDEEIEELFSDDAGTESSTCIGLRWMPKVPSPEIIIKRLGKLNKVKFLMLLGNVDYCFPGDWKFDQTKQYFPNSLQYLAWDGYPGLSLPQTFGNNLVGLSLIGSSIVQLWKNGEREVLNKLRFLEIGNSKLRTLDLRMTPNLESLILYKCHDLTEVHAPARCLKRLALLDLRGCSWSVSFSLSKQLESLVLLSLPNLFVYVESLEELPRDSTNNLPMLQFEFHYLEEETWTTKIFLDLQPCTKLESVSGSICGLQHLTLLTIDGCIPELPDDIDQLKCLEHLALFSTRIKCLPDSVCLLKHLKILQLESCEFLEKLPEDIGQLECLEVLSLTKCESLRDIPNSICNMKCLRYLNLRFCSRVQKLPEDFGNLKHLVGLYMLFTGISHLPNSISSLKGLAIIGSRSLLQSCAAFTTEIETSKEFGTFCYIKAVNSTPSPTELRSHSTENYLKRLTAKFWKGTGSVQEMFNVRTTTGSGSTRSSNTFRSKIHRLRSHF